jgi:hypothetical protein
MKALVKKFAELFLGAEGVEEVKKAGVNFAFGWSAFWIFEWAVTIATGVAVGWLLGRGWQEGEIFLALWLGNMLLNRGILIADGKLKVDFTAMNGSRRVVDVAWKKAWWSGAILEALAVIWLVFWQGSAGTVIFFKKRINSVFLRTVVFVGTSAIQIFLWTKVYVYGYTLWQAIRSIVAH